MRFSGLAHIRNYSKNNSFTYEDLASICHFDLIPIFIVWIVSGVVRAAIIRPETVAGIGKSAAGAVVVYVARRRPAGVYRSRRHSCRAGFQMVRLPSRYSRRGPLFAEGQRPVRPACSTTA